MAYGASRKWLLLGALLALHLSPVGAQQDTVSSPPWQPPADTLDGAPAGYLDSFRSGAFQEGYFFQYDALCWTVTRPSNEVIGNTDPSLAPPGGYAIGAGGLPTAVQNNVQTTWDQHGSWGHRFEFGNVEGDRGWLGGVFWGENSQTLNATGAQLILNDPNDLMLGYVDANGDDIDDDLNGNGVFGRNGLRVPDPSAQPPFRYDTVPGGPDTGDVMRFMPLFAALQVTTATEITGLDLMRVHRWGSGHPHSMVDVYWGARYLKVKDWMDVVATGGVLDASYWSTIANNDIVGPQVGARWGYQIRDLTLVAEGRFLPGVNFQRVNQSGSLATNIQPGGANRPLNLMPNYFAAATDTTVFSPVGEWRLETIWHLHRYFAVRLGYTGMVIDNVNRGAGKVVYDMPSFGMSTANSHETLVVSAFTIGLDINR